MAGNQAEVRAQMWARVHADACLYGTMGACVHVITLEDTSAWVFLQRCVIVFYFLPLSGLWRTKQHDCPYGVVVDRRSTDWGVGGSGSPYVFFIFTT